ncbi:hypothetical protein ABZ605_28210 [Streptomyces sp. NPDC012765]|uniref:hypothetical protein n=1 Tax=Streptomyces sp. NPDC012765 TaxID=3155249 RepID=UPI0034095789
MSRPMPSPGSTAVYRLWNADGELLYIGISHNPPGRYVQHERDKPWWPAVHRRQESWYDTRQEAEAAERAAIGSELPAYNATDGNGANKVPQARVGQDERREAQAGVLARLEADLLASRYPLHRLLPTPVELGREYGYAASDIVSALDELQRQGMVQRIDSNRYVLPAPGRHRGETARGLLLQEIVDGLGTGPFSRKDIRILTGRSAGVIDRYVADLVAEGRLTSAGRLRSKTSHRAVEHYVVPASGTTGGR